MRALALHLPVEQRWRLFDNDRDLLAYAARMTFSDVHIEPIALDLGRELEAALETPIDLITCFALLDLVSEDWLEQFASMVVARRCPVYAALTYDGRITTTPADAFDEPIIQAVNDHQRKDKGFGPALGPRSAPWAVARFQALGYSVIRGASDWMLAPTDCDIQMELLSGWARAANEHGLAPEDVAAWLDRRRELVAASRSSIEVGHTDFWACQTGARAPERSKSNNTSSSN
ncbi:MAG TPA: SAM-dependent methyltransferase [Roseiarcus sp.]|nr:SAM-dependent methyltransferase [Roseiarcus sp.]